MNILGISAYYHDSAAALVIDGKVLAAAQEERFTRNKHTPDFPLEAIKYCLDEAGLEIDDLDAVVFYDKPFLKFERLLETYYAFAPKGLISFLKAIPVWIKEKLFLKKQLYNGLKQVGNFDQKKLKLLFTEHHLSHAASAFYPSGFDQAAILTIDGAGEWATAAIGFGSGKNIEIKKELHFPHSVGLLYSAFTYFLGFKVNSGEYKLMGLAPYGNMNSDQVKRFVNTIKTHLVDIKSDGSIWLDQHYFKYATDLRMIHHKKWEKLFGFERRKEETPIEQHHCDLALAIQLVTEEIVLNMAKEAKRLTESDYLVMAGGVALNCVANGKLLRENIFKEIYIQPAAGDAGGALGAALAAQYLYFEKEGTSKRSSGQNILLGPEYSSKEVEKMNRKMNAHADEFDSIVKVNSFMADKLASGKIVGWFQGRMEFGPRALGNRSILADARNPEMQQKLNLGIKMRENFRPFAPAVLAEDANQYFDLNTPSPYMLFTAPILDSGKIVVTGKGSDINPLEKLKILRSDIPAVTHVDYSARVQTVDQATNESFWKLLTEFKKQTGCSVLVNTSFNLRGEPMVCTPLDAYRCFMASDMDYLVINNFVYSKINQPDWQNKRRWQVQFNPD